MLTWLRRLFAHEAAPAPTSSKSPPVALGASVSPSPPAECSVIAPSYPPLGPPVQPPAGTLLAPREAAFALRVLATLAADPRGNVLVATPTLYTPLLLARLAADGDTGDALARTLAAADLSVDALVDEAARLHAALGDLGDGVELSQAAALFASDRLVLDGDFLARARGAAFAAVETCDTFAPEGVDRVNAWVEERTRGRIDRIVGSGDVGPMILVAALFFNGRWRDRFDPEDTQDAVFRRADGPTRCRLMMGKSDPESPWRMLHDDALYGVRVPYRGDRIGFYAIRPRKDGALDAWARGLDAARLDELVRRFAPADELTVFLPRIETDVTVRLGGVLDGIGMEGRLTSARAPLDRLGRLEGGVPVLLTDVVQRVRMTVDEEGTIVAAATAGLTLAAGIPPRIVFDRPFFFAIVDDETRLPLVCGLIRSPHDGAPETPDAAYTDRWEFIGRMGHLLAG